MILVILACATEAALPLGADAEACSSCHTDHGAEWSTSPHAHSAESEVFTALLPRVDAAWGGFARQQCEGCHAPGWGGDAGIGCVSCHAAVGNHEEGNGALAVDENAPLSGNLVDAASTPAHTSVARTFLKSASLCGTCHEVDGPGLVDEATLVELRETEGVASECGTCHVADDGLSALVAGGAARAVHDHRFTGLDVRGGADPELSRKLLQKALTLRVEDGAAFVTNVGGGHRVPTGVSFLRDLWVEAETPTGPVRVVTLSDQPTHAGVPVALLTDADDIEIRSLAANETVRATLPQGTTQVKLRAQATRAAVREALGLDPDPIVFEIATVSVNNPG